jgi:hypothetical protein
VKVAWQWINQTNDDVDGLFRPGGVSDIKEIPYPDKYEIYLQRTYETHCIE